MANPKQTAHTPTPWSIGYTTNRKYSGLGDWHETAFHVGQASPGNAIGVVSMGGPGALQHDAESVESNAKFIVRAVNSHAVLVEALEAVLTAAKDHHFNSVFQEWDNEQIGEAAKLAEAALKAARGE